MKRNRKFRVAVIGTLISFGVALAPTANAAKVTPIVYNFKAVTVQGQAFNGASLIGKPSVLWFWAPWCGICRGESPDLVALAKAFKGKINLVGVASLGPVNDMKGFIKDTHTGNFTHIADESGAVWNRFQIPAQPSFVFLTKSGIAYRQIGALTQGELFSFTKDLLKKA